MVVKVVGDVVAVAIVHDCIWLSSLMKVESIIWTWSSVCVHVFVNVY